MRDDNVQCVSRKKRRPYYKMSCWQWQNTGKACHKSRSKTEMSQILNKVLSSRYANNKVSGPTFRDNSFFQQNVAAVTGFGCEDSQHLSTSTSIKKHVRLNISRSQWKGTNFHLSPLTRDSINIFLTLLAVLRANRRKPVAYFGFWLIDLKQPYFPRFSLRDWHNKVRRCQRETEMCQ